MCENIEKCCRICLDGESQHVSIFNDFMIHHQIKCCLDITISSTDNLPKTICTSCVSQLSDFYNFKLNARCSQDWLESSLQEQMKKSTESKMPIQPLPDSEYNSDSLLEFLNNTANIEEYLNNLGKEDIPSIVSMLDRNQENSVDGVVKLTNNIKATKQPSPKKKETVKTKSCIKMQIDVLDSDIEIVKELLMKETEPKKSSVKEKNVSICFACKTKFDNPQKLAQHLSTCDYALRTCIHCHLLFDSKQKMQEHSLSHGNGLICNCGKQFLTKEKLIQHHKTCHGDCVTSMGFIYRCKQCKDTFKERYLLYKHAKEHIIKAEERVCDICGHTFNGNEALNKHKEEMHEKPQNSMFRCKICHHTSLNKREIYLHVQKHCTPTKHQIDRHLCDSCGRSFASRASLLRHVSQHISEYKCTICQRSFKDVKTRDAHVLEHTETAICEKCGQNVNSFKLEAHSCI